MNALLDAVAAAFTSTAQQRFRVLTSDGEATLQRRQYTSAQGHRVLWPFESTPEAIGDFFSALLDGVKPIVLSPKTAPAKLAALSATFNAASYRKGEITGLSPLSLDTSDACLYVSTSGSTGQPKAVAASLSRLASMVDAIHVSQQLHDVASVVASLPLGFSSGLINQLLWAVQTKRALHIDTNSISPISLLSFAATLKSEMVCLVKSQVDMMTRLGDTHIAPLEQVKVVNFSGEFFPEKHIAYLNAQLPNARLYNNYGCTEAMPRVSLRQVRNDSTLPSKNIGHCIPGVQVRIADNAAAGPIEFLSSHAAIGYLTEGGTLCRFDAWIRSGDDGQLIDGELHLQGRNDQLVKIGGERHSLKEVEFAVENAGYAPAVACLNADNQVVVIVPVATVENALNIKAIQQQLAPILRPRAIYTNTESDVLPNGKTDRKRIIARHHRNDPALTKIWPQTRSK